MEVFSKILSVTDLNVRLAIPAKALQHFGNPGGRDLRVRDLLVRDWTEQEWNFRLSTRDGDHPKPVFTGDWGRFARAKGLQVNDLLIFTQREDGEYRIDVYRKTDFVLFGQPIIRIHVDQA
ncbi:hypothetical protein Pint_28666 [Pistacia integerrima]|uniref:Uncharacterized protein n=1 Tax=Pistacia integerrima TaxID=434235 RepID=A0ACC0YTA7_9ROSI|nr:hypothetical protein Pint_28666 [Pistacia integerrima]